MADSLLLFPELSAFAQAALARATVLLAGALALSLLLARASAAARHAFWTVTAVALLVLPWLPGFLPALPVPVALSLPLRGGAGSGVVEGPAATGGTVREGSGLVGPAGTGGTTVREGGVVEGRPAWPSTTWESRPGRAADGGGFSPTAADPLAAEPAGASGAGPSAAPASRARETAAAGRALLLLLWLGGTLAATGGLAAGVWRVLAVARRAPPVAEPAWRSSLSRARARVGLGRKVALRTSASAPTPVAGGVFRPFILLPRSAVSWTEERRELVLLHELVHVARHDALRQLLARLMLALYWFHPLARLAARQAVLAREQACDEAVIALGQRPSVYARHLLELSEPACTPLPALPFMERPQLEQRLMAILKPGRRPRRGATLVAALSALAWALAVAAASPTAVEAEAKLAAAQTAPQPPRPAPPARPAPPPAPPVSPPSLEPPAPPAPPAPPEQVPPPEPAPPASVPAPEAPPVPPAPPGTVPRQEWACWADGAGQDFVGTLSTSLDEAGARVTERFGRVGSDRVVQAHLDDVTVCMRASGRATFTADGSAIESLGEDGSIVMASRAAGRVMELTVAAGGTGPTYTWVVDGAVRDLSPEGEDWLRAMVPLLADYWTGFEVREQASDLRRELAVAAAREGALPGDTTATAVRPAEPTRRDLDVLGDTLRIRGVSSVRGEAPVVFIDGIRVGASWSVERQIADLDAERRLRAIESRRVIQAQRLRAAIDAVP